MEARQSVPANGEASVHSLQPGVVSLLAKLLVEFPLIRARHPLSVILMNGRATDFLRTDCGITLSGINPSAMSTHGNTCHEQATRNDAEQLASHLASKLSHRPSPF